jgi:hypothetical protein
VLFAQAAAALAQRAGRPPLAGQVPALRGPHFARPLFVVAAVLLTVWNTNIDVDALSPDELLAEIVSGESLFSIQTRRA